MKGFQVYHLNLAFSSIPAESRPDVIKRCYWPLLELAEGKGIPIGIELTGWTLRQIETIDRDWIAKFKTLLEARQCELIGSGWTQMIGPLVPYEMNVWNQRLGIEAYEECLGLRPRLVLVNEMAYSSSLVDVYAANGYEGLIMDRDNVRLALDLDHHPDLAVPSHALGLNGQSLPVLWSDSILFQRLQRVVHGDIPISEYLEYLQRLSSEDENVLPIYCNDAEIFDFRPGRFTTEASLHSEGEWSRIGRVCDLLVERLGLGWVSPSEALAAQNDGKVIHAATLSSSSYPIPVKKQAKYNINRWAVTGRDDLWLNTTCHSLLRRLKTVSDASPELWRELAEFWASDLRTHITESRWNDMLARLSNFEEMLPSLVEFSVDDSAAAESAEVRITKHEEGIYWSCESKFVKLVFNARRGLTLKSLGFVSHGGVPLLGTLAQGFFDSIDLGADYYSGGVLIEIPGERIRLTDLEWMNPDIRQTQSHLIIQGEQPMAGGRLVKTISISLHEESVSLSYEFKDWERPIGIVRVGILTLLPDAVVLPLNLQCQNGGDASETFSIESSFNHAQPASLFVSSTAAIGATDGRVSLTDARGVGFEVSWDPAQCAAVPLLKHLKTPSSHLTRLSFSLCELDDTSKKGGRLLPLTLHLRPLSKS
ncbi:MAG: hypothetical protein RL015_3472 [Verrucomicrobiota bacterium]|jgi:hypothetical protein